RPCDTYRIKMAIVDAGNALYDSGVFIEAGSLKTNSFFFDASATAHTINGVNNAIVKGCGTDSVYVKSNRRVSAATTIKFSYGGTAASGVDFTSYDSVTINAGDSSAAFPITGLTTTPGGVKTATIYITSFTVCGVRYTGVSDSIVVSIFDHPQMAITTNDTVVCTGQTVNINTAGTAGLSYSWSPTTGLSSATSPTPSTTVTSPVTYVVTATYPGTTCAPITDSIKVSSVMPAMNLITTDTTICEGYQFQIRVSGADTLYYSWSPSAGLSSGSAKEPLFTGSATTSYVLTATIPRSACSVTGNIKVTVVPRFAVTAHDTFICEGNNLYLNAEVTPPGGAYAYQWTGPSGYSSVQLNPVITTSAQNNKGTYYLTVTNMGMCPLTVSENVDVYPTPKASILAPEITYCQYAPSSPVMIPGYSNVMWYDNRTDKTPTLFAPYPNTDSIGTQKFYAAQISLVSNCLSEMQEIEVHIKSCCNGSIMVPTAFTPNFDGKNDVLRVVKSAEYVVNEFVIYNRWGVPVFEASGEKQAWDGTYNGEPADIGTYYYSVIANCINSDKKQITLKGDVTLVR
ncbi:MAG: gliding motility-associated C-terminal domain-containing protein, partial [Chitinophagia bacterium]|nr:gliding motility-associated C-terminal domain-containing protein [Chitinophagia bacterium]